MHWTYCGMPKGTSRAEFTSNSEKIKPVALAVIKFSQSVENFIRYFFLIPWQLLKVFWVDLKAYLVL